jgi:hypothetical protein
VWRPSSREAPEHSSRVAAAGKHRGGHINIVTKKWLSSSTRYCAASARVERVWSRLPDALLWSLKFAENLSFRSASVATHTAVRAMMASLPALLLGASALLAGLAGGRGPAAAQQQCSSTSHCPAHQFCDHEATNSHCEPCTACAGCLCNLPAAGAANCRAACLAAPPGPPKHPTFPTLPKALTPTQLQVQRQAADIAAVATPAARPQVAALMGSPATNKYLRQFDDGSNLAALSGSELLGRFEAELDTVELVHNFGFPHPQSCGIDVTIASGPRAPDFYNQWVIQAAGIYPVDPNNNVFMEKTERDTFGFPPMADLGAPDLATAANRPVYAATNFYRDSAMNFQCGPVAAAFNREFIGAQALGFPVDSGNFGPTGCTANDAPFKPGLVEGNWSACFNCKDCVHEGLRPLGVPGNLTHFLLPYVHLYNVTMLAKDVQGQLVGADYPSYNLARLLTRKSKSYSYSSPSPSPSPSPTCRTPTETQCRAFNL